MGDVIEYIVDGTSGLSPGDVSGSCIIAGVCSLGEAGKGYLLGASSDLEGLLGVGPLVDRLRDLFATAGQKPVVVAVPVAGSAGGYISNLEHTGEGPDSAVAGVPAGNADVVVKITTAGVLGTAAYSLSLDGAETFAEAETTAANGQISIGTTGATLTLGEGTQVVDDLYSFVVRTAIGPVEKTGTGPDITVTGTVKAAAEIMLGVVSGGGLNEATYQLSTDGGDAFDVERTVPVDGVITVGSTGVTITVPDETLVAGDIYECRLLPPVPSISGVMTAIEGPLELYDVEFVYVVGPTDSVDWAVMGAKADTQFNAHRPVFFLSEYRLPYADEDLNDWVAEAVNESNDYAHRFVAVCASVAEVSDVTGQTILRNPAGLLAGRILATPVMRAIGRVRDAGISQAALPDDYTSSMQVMLESARYITLKRYAGLSSAYWGDGKTMADVTSDYQYLEVLRVVFKAVRKARIAALKSMYDEAGDPVMEGEDTGLQYLKANIETALNTLVSAVPKELAAHQVSIPSGQDIVNNGVAVEMVLIGIPIIRSISLFASYVYAGSTFDPRLETTD
ncbi:DUF2586 domain-containing protein [uncultured Desulfobacter sp.]|uniref:DUF2586 domain-containing protein n=1 Tax=uncultured Desulfobacter sp. TaxID=240139 RepID=UPI002AAB0BD8|nr:DUF2586 domain-containing protein [uncultured Desulfobacter sp.]